jgi:hypothetical protein
MEQTVRRALLRRWVRGSVAIGLLLVLPMAVAHLEARLDPQYERREIARSLERHQRASGVPFVTASGEAARAVVYSPTFPTQEGEDARHRYLMWWSRLLATVTAIGLLAQTWRIIRQRGGTPSSRPVT